MALGWFRIHYCGASGLQVWGFALPTVSNKSVAGNEPGLEPQLYNTLNPKPLNPKPHKSLNPIKP